MKEQIIISLSGLPKELITFIIAMLPIFELRGAIPFGIYNKVPFLNVLIISIIGNLLPVIPIYFLLNRVFAFLKKYKYGRMFSDWLTRHAFKRSKMIELYEMLGLIIFVGIPLPMTGAWTGTLISVLLKLKPKYYFIGIICGVLLAAVIVSAIMLFVYRI